jgi:hypothetical protein
MVTEVVNRLHDAIDGVRQLDVDALTDAEAEEVAHGTIRARVELLVISARATRRWERSGAWAADGSKSAAARLARDVNCSLREARRDLRFGRALESMPHTTLALRRAEISEAHAEMLITANRDRRQGPFALDEAWLVEQARAHRFAEFATIVNYWCERVDPDGCEAIGRELLEKASLTAATTLDGSMFVQGLLDPIGGEMFREGLRRIERELKRQDKANGVERSATQRRAAALVEMAMRANAAPVGGLRPEPLVMIVIGNEALSRTCELGNGKVITPGLLVPYLSMAQIQGIVFDDAKPIPSMSPQRTFTGWLRRAIQVRDRHCQHPAGCDEPITRCDVDHILPNVAGGRTAYANGRLQCATHNRNAIFHDRAPPP